MYPIFYNTENDKGIMMHSEPYNKTDLKIRRSSNFHDSFILFLSTIFKFYFNYIFRNQLTFFFWFRLSSKIFVLTENYHLPERKNYNVKNVNDKYRIYVLDNVIRTWFQLQKIVIRPTRLLNFCIINVIYKKHRLVKKKANFIETNKNYSHWKVVHSRAYQEEESICHLTLS